MATFTGIEDIAYANLAGTNKKARKIDTLAHTPTGVELTGSTQLSSTGDTWGYFEETAGSTEMDKYSVFFFFEASSVNITACTYTTATSDKYEIYNKIYHLTGDTNNANIYAIKLAFKERYDGTSSSQSAQYTTTINIKTNDPDLPALNKVITVTHNFCKAVS